MILADTCIWVDHFRGADRSIATVLVEQTIVTHPFVIGELALGNPHNRADILSDLNDLPLVMPVRHIDVMTLIEAAQLYGTGLQHVDAHLLAAARITNGCRIWTRDKRLRSAAERLGVAADLD